MVDNTEATGLKYLLASSNIDDNYFRYKLEFNCLYLFDSITILDWLDLYVEVVYLLKPV